MMHIQILGTRGIPSQHGGFETFAQDLALHLAGNGHRVTVYCQAETGEQTRESVWRGIRLIHIPAPLSPAGTMKFDLKCVLHSCREEGIALTLGYNTALFSLFYRLCGHKNIMNMDGLEWRRKKWSLPAKLWLLLNEWLGARFANHLIADHPEIARHLARHTRASRITMIPYGSVVPAPSQHSLLDALSLKPGEYDLVIARPEPENSICEIVQAFSARPRATELIILGHYLPDLVPYHAEVLRNAGTQVRFIGPVYDRELVGAMRMHARSYIHGHRVGGTNPSLVEAMACANPIIAHDNPFTRWGGWRGGYLLSRR